MKRKEKKRILWVYTDDLAYVKGEYSEKFRNLKNVDDIKYEILDNSTIIANNNDDINTIVNVVIIKHFDSLSHKMLIDLINLIQTEKINLIYTNRIDMYNQCYTSMVGPNTDSKHPTCDNNFIEEIQKNFTLWEINVAIISSDIKFMSHLITNLSEKIDNRNKIDTKTDYYDASIALELDSKMPKLIQQWVYNVWYGKKSNLVLPKPPTNNITTAKLYKVITVNVNNEKLVNYYFINPYNNANLSSCINHFDVLLIDMQTHYSAMDFGRDISDLNIIPFIKTPIDNICDKSVILNIISNMITYTRGNYKSGMEGTICNEYHPDDVSQSIKLTGQCIRIDNINVLRSITPF